MREYLTSFLGLISFLDFMLEAKQPNTLLLPSTMNPDKINARVGLLTIRGIAPLTMKG